MLNISHPEKHRPRSHLSDIHLLVDEEIGLKEGNCLVQTTQQESR